MSMLTYLRWPLPQPIARVCARGSLAALSLIVADGLCQSAGAQAPPQSLPPIVVEGAPANPAPKAAPKAKTAAAKRRAGQGPRPPSPPVPVESAPPQPVEPAVLDPTAPLPGGSLTVPTTSQAQANFSRIPGTALVVPDTAYKYTTPAVTVRDVLEYVPGIVAQPKWGDDTRLSIRGSGLSRNFHLRGVELFLDGVPINTADGFGDFQEIDPSAYRYVEVLKGANGRRLGASTLGGAINFVTPTGRDADLFGASLDIGSFGFHRLQSNSGAASGPVDYFITGSWQELDGFREHSGGEATRMSGNLGYQLSPDAETRFYINANEVRQRIPGSLTKDLALSSPRTAATSNVIDDWQRNIDTFRFANKTTIRMSPATSVEFGAFGVDRHLMHPIFQWLDYKYRDYGLFGRLNDEREVAGFKNRFLFGANLHNGSTDADQYVNSGGNKGDLLSSSRNDSENVALNAENAFYFLPRVAFVTGVQYLYATRELTDKFLSDGDQSGRNAFSTWNPKVGLLWEIDRAWQVYGNISRSAEVPSFGENSFASASAFDAKMQTALTYEIGTRGRRPDYAWDLAAYRMDIDNELQCSFPFGVADFCIIQNADKTVHQGVEIGGGAAVLKSMFVHGDRPDRLWLNAAYTFSDFRFDDDAVFGNNQLPGAPRHMLRAELLYKHPSGVYLGPNIEWVPQAYFVDSANTLDTEPYGIWGLKAGFAPEGAAYSFYIDARNLADKHYIASTSITNVANPAVTNFFEPGTGRAIYAGVKYKW
jgi:iron complex outermembrane receptor protein